MDFMNTTFAQVLQMTNDRLPELTKQIDELLEKCNVAGEVLAYARQRYDHDPDNAALYKAVDEADNKYWELLDSLSSLRYERVQLQSLTRVLKYIPNCKDLVQVATVIAVD